MPSVLVLPSDDPSLNDGLGPLLDAIPGALVVDPEPGPGSLAARTCLAINARGPESPVTIVTFGEKALLLPAIALSQRTAHRRVAEYLMIEPPVPPVTESWPDARVTVITDDASSTASLQGRLRGWAVLDRESLSSWRPEPA